MTFTTTPISKQIEQIERSISEEKEHLAELKAARDRATLYACEIEPYPEGSLQWIFGMRRWIEDAPGCPFDGSPVEAFEHENGWNSPSDDELLSTPPEQLAEELPAVVERINEMCSLLDDSSICSYCRHRAEKAD